MRQNPARRFGATAGLVAGALVSTGLTAALALRTTTLLPDGGALRVDDLVALAVTAAGALVAGWLALSTTAALGCVLARLLGATWRTGEALVTRVAPTVVRRALAATVVAGLGVSLATGAQAATPGTPDPAAATATATATVDVGWRPTATGDATAGPDAGAGIEVTTTAAVDADTHPVDTTWRPTRVTASAPATSTTTAGAQAAPASAPSPGQTATGTGTEPAVDAPLVLAASTTAQTPSAPGAPGTAATTASPPASRGAAPDSDVVEVTAGDTLWSIAAAHLPADATDTDVAAAWPAWYEANRDVIGDDPDLLRPGQRLRAPALTPSTSTSSPTHTATEATR